MRLYVAGIKGMVGSAIAQEAKKQGYEVVGKSSSHLNFTNRRETFAEIQAIKPDILVVAAAKVGGIGANASMPVDFLSINLQIQSNLLDAAFTANVAKVLFLGSSCVYPKLAPQPISESYLLTGELEPTNEAYAIAKIAGLKLVEAYRRQFGRNWISAMPSNLYGPRDNFDIETAHVVPALIHRFYNAKSKGEGRVEIWGDGTPLREFLFVEDLARACLMLIEKYDASAAINVGSGQEIAIADLALLIANTVGYRGEIIFNADHPNGTPRKLLDSTRITELGWSPQVTLQKGLEATLDWFRAHHIKEDV
jgi:GDP-L-fucose synthase